MQKRKLQSDGCHCVRWAGGAGRIPVPRLPEPPFGTVTGQTRSAAVPTAELLSPAAAARDPSRQALGVCGARAAAGWSCGAGTQTYLDAISQIPFMSFLIWGALFDFSAIKWG